MITCKYNSKQFLIRFLLHLLPPFYLVFMLLKEMFLYFFGFNKESDWLISSIIICFFPMIIICSMAPVFFFKILNYHKYTFFEIWGNKLICKYKNKEIVINYKDINYLLICNNKKDNMGYIESINYGSNKKVFLF